MGDSCENTIRGKLKLPISLRKDVQSHQLSRKYKYMALRCHLYCPDWQILLILVTARVS